MSVTEKAREQRRAREHAASRAAILEAARRVAGRDGARDLSLRAVAAEAGFSAAALYGYFADKDEMVLALAAEELSVLSRAMREALEYDEDAQKLARVCAAALDILENAEAIAAAPGALQAAGIEAGETERLFNGRLIAALKTLSDATGTSANSRAAQGDIVLLAAALAGLALFARSGRLEALGFTSAEMLARVDARFGA